MRDFLIKLLGGYKAVVVIVDRRVFSEKIVSKMVTCYPFVQTIIKTKSGIVSFNKNNEVKFED